jgi:hypothetical protein
MAGSVCCSISRGEGGLERGAVGMGSDYCLLRHCERTTGVNRSCDKRSQRQVQHSINPFDLIAAQRNQKYFIDGLRHAQPVAHHKDARHGHRIGDALERESRMVARSCVNTMRSFAALHSENVRVVSGAKADILHPDDIDDRRSSAQCPHNIAVEVLICDQPKHVIAHSALRRARSRFRMSLRSPCWRSINDRTCSACCSRCWR